MMRFAYPSEAVLRTFFALRPAFAGMMAIGNYVALGNPQSRLRNLSGRRAS